MIKKWFVLLNVILITLAAMMPPTPMVQADPPGGTTDTDTYQVYNYQYNVAYDTVNGYEWQLPLISLMQGDLDNWAFFVFRQIDHNASDVYSAKLSFYAPYTSLNNATHSVTVYGFRENDTDPLTLDPLPGAVIPPISRHVTTATASLNVTTWAEGWHNVTVTDIVKEIVGLPGWANLNNIGFKTLAVTDVDWYIWSYSGNSSLCAKLYLEYYNGTKTYPGDWENGTLYNTTDEGEMWEIWNGSKMGYMINQHQPSGDTRTWNSDSYTYHALALSGTYVNMGAFEQNTFVKVGSYLYTYVINATSSQSWLYRSANDGLTWTALKNLGFGVYGNCRVFADDEFIHFFYGVSTIDWEYKVYNITSGNMVTGHGVGKIQATFVANVMHVYMYNPTGTGHTQKGRFRLLCQYSTNSLGVYDKDSLDDTTWTTTGITSGSGFTTGAAQLCTAWNETNQYHAYYGTAQDLGGYVLQIGYYIDGDLSITAHEHINPDSGSLCASVCGRLTVNSDTGVIGATWQNRNIDADAKKIKYRERSTGKTGTWGSEVTIHLGTGAAVYCFIFYDTLMNPDSFTITFMESADTYANIYQPDGDLIDDTHYQPAGYQAGCGFIINTLDTEGTHYYQWHWFNCTWLTPTLTPQYPSPPVEPEENVPDPVTGLVYFDRFHMRLYFLVFGLGCLLSPPMLWAYGYDDLKTVLGGLISMVIGIGLLIQITSI